MIKFGSLLLSAEPATVGTLIEWLETQPEDKILPLDNYADSYRGYYEHVAIPLKLIRNQERSMEFVDYVNPEKTEQKQSKKIKVTVTIEDLIDEQYFSTDFYEDGEWLADSGKRVSLKDLGNVEEFVKMLTQKNGIGALWDWLWQLEFFDKTACTSFKIEELDS